MKFLSHPRVETRISHMAKNRNCAVSLVRKIGPIMDGCLPKLYLMTLAQLTRWSPWQWNRKIGIKECFGWSLSKILSVHLSTFQHGHYYNNDALTSLVSDYRLLGTFVYLYSGTCLIQHTKAPGKCVWLYRMPEYSGFILVNRNTLGP